MGSGDKQTYPGTRDPGTRAPRPRETTFGGPMFRRNMITSLKDGAGQVGGRLVLGLECRAKKR